LEVGEEDIDADWWEDEWRCERGGEEDEVVRGVYRDSSNDLGETTAGVVASDDGDVDEGDP